MLGGGRAALDPLDARRGRPAPRPIRERRHRLLRTLHQRLDFAGEAITHPTAQAEPFGLPLQGVAKADTLHLAADEQVDGLHL